MFNQRFYALFNYCSFLGFGSRALLPYAQALLRFPAHIQQVSFFSGTFLTATLASFPDPRRECIYVVDSETFGVLLCDQDT